MVFRNAYDMKQCVVVNQTFTVPLLAYSAANQANGLKTSRNFLLFYLKLKSIIWTITFMLSACYLTLFLWSMPCFNKLISCLLCFFFFGKLNIHCSVESGAVILLKHPYNYSLHKAILPESSAGLGNRLEIMFTVARNWYQGIISP